MTPSGAILRATFARGWKQLNSAVVLIVATTGCQTFSGNDTLPPASVARLEGIARGSMDGGTTWLPLKPGAVVQEGAQIQTGQNTLLDINLRYQPAPAGAKVTVVQLRSDSHLSIDKLTSVRAGTTIARAAHFNLLRGRVNGNTDGITPASDYEVRFADGLAHVMLNTAYEISREGIVIVREGEVVVNMVDGREYKLRGGEMLDVRTGQTTPIPPLKESPAQPTDGRSRHVPPPEWPPQAPRRQF